MKNLLIALMMVVAVILSSVNVMASNPADATENYREFPVVCVKPGFDFSENLNSQSLLINTPVSTTGWNIWAFDWNSQDIEENDVEICLTKKVNNNLDLSASYTALYNSGENYGNQTRLVADYHNSLMGIGIVARTDDFNESLISPRVNISKNVALSATFGKDYQIIGLTAKGTMGQMDLAYDNGDTAYVRISKTFVTKSLFVTPEVKASYNRSTDSASVGMTLSLIPKGK